MVIFRFITLAIFILSLGACGEVPAKLAPANEQLATSSDTLVFLYQKEQKGEVWISGPSAHVLESFAWSGNYPLGALVAFTGTDSSYQNDQLRRFQGKRTFVLPHRPNSKGQLDNCFACRHDEVETYAMLNLVLKQLK